MYFVQYFSYYFLTYILTKISQVSNVYFKNKTLEVAPRHNIQRTTKCSVLNYVDQVRLPQGIECDLELSKAFGVRSIRTSQWTTIDRWLCLHSLTDLCRDSRRCSGSASRWLLIERQLVLMLDGKRLFRITQIKFIGWDMDWT